MIVINYVMLYIYRNCLKLIVLATVFGFFHALEVPRVLEEHVIGVIPISCEPEYSLGTRRRDHPITYHDGRVCHISVLS